MTQLIIDTSSEESLIALLCEGKILASRIRRHANALARTLMPDIASLLLEKELTLKEISSIAVGIGPGSYTGTRVGVSIARTLSYACSLPLVNFCSLLAFVPEQLGNFACVMPSRTGDFFLLKGITLENLLTINTMELVPLSTLISSLENVETLVAKPFEEMKQVLSLPWSAPIATFNTIAKFLNSSTQVTYVKNSIETDLIYLHTP